MFAAKNELFTRPSGSYQISRSVRLRASASAYFGRTPSVAGNRQIWTWSAWVKRGSLGSAQTLFNASDGTGTNEALISFPATDVFRFYSYIGSMQLQLDTTQVFRDPSAWYHFVVSVDTTQATASNRAKLYVNGSQITALGVATYPAQNYDTYINTTQPHSIGRDAFVGRYFDGYLTEINFISGQALTPSSFGSTNAVTGVWQPIKYTGTYGTNGFYLNFSDNSNNTATTIGKDYSGNGNNWTPNNISVTAGVTYDSMVDSPTVGATSSNYCVLNPLLPLNSTASDGNLKGTLNAASVTTIMQGTLAGGGTGKFYWESTYVSRSGNSALTIGGVRSDVFNADPSGTGGFGYYSVGGQVFVNGSTVATYATYATGDVIGVALDLTNNQVTFYKNGTSQGTVSISSGYSWMPAFANGTSTGNQVVTINCGQQPFTYTPPSGFVALNTQNLPTPTISNGANYMAASLWTGNGSTQTITNTVNGISMQPDWVWIKARSAATYHREFDSVRGIYKALPPNDTLAEQNFSPYGVTAFNSNGFSLNDVASSGYNVNESGTTYVGWQWKASGSTVSNANGSITSTVSAGATQGFSVVTYTGNGTAGATVGHGLGVAPSMIIVKCRSNAATNWATWQTTLLGSEYLYLNSTAAKGTGNTSLWNGTVPSSTVITVGTDNDTNANTRTYVAYAFSAVAGYSAFGSYTGNASTDGPFVYCGFRPRFVMFKSLSGPRNWAILDSGRNTSNVANFDLYPNLSLAEITQSTVDFLSNGFKLRVTDSDFNAAETYIYMAFAENPFKLSLAR